MKKNLVTALILVTGITFFASCKKENADLTPQSGQELATQKIKDPKAPSRIKTETSSFGTKNYTYNADFNSTGNTGVSPKVYTYPDATHIIETPSSGPVVTYQLNKKGLIETASTDYTTQYWTFDSKNQLTEIKTVGNSSGSVSYFKYVYNSDGNLDTLSEIANGTVSWWETFTYYTDQPNVMDNDVFGEGFKGVSSKNLLKSSESHYPNYVSVWNQWYAYDPYGRVVKVSHTVNGNPQSDYIYTYY
ncbi:MAG TPA: hypothetical protein VGQ04_12655 [Chitinophagaceae bacterium]|nr:hypothetical protein [Chitinophagaceae bacterium]